MTDRNRRGSWWRLLVPAESKTEKLVALAVIVAAGAVLWRARTNQTLPASAPAASPAPARSQRWTNSLGQIFLPVPGLDVMFCIWDTRVQDYRAYANANAGVVAQWDHAVFQGQPVNPQATCPVINVNWDEAAAYCAWLTQKERAAGVISRHQSYRLPADWEWSAAAGLNENRSGTPADKDGKIMGLYPWGAQWPPPKGAGNYADAAFHRAFPDLSFVPDYDDGYTMTSPAGAFPPNQFGLCDMGGNVWQWCEDWSDYSRKYRVLRGASWISMAPRTLLASDRNNCAPDTRLAFIGFRCVLAEAAGER